MQVKKYSKVSTYFSNIDKRWETLKEIEKDLADVTRDVIEIFEEYEVSFEAIETCKKSFKLHLEKGVTFEIIGLEEFNVTIEGNTINFNNKANDKHYNAMYDAIWSVSKFLEV